MYVNVKSLRLIHMLRMFCDKIGYKSHQKPLSSQVTHNETCKLNQSSRTCPFTSAGLFTLFTLIRSSPLPSPHFPPLFTPLSFPTQTVSGEVFPLGGNSTDGISLFAGPAASPQPEWSAFETGEPLIEFLSYPWPWCYSKVDGG